MFKRETRCGFGRQAVAVFLCYALALHLITAGLVGATSATQGFDSQTLPGLQALCLPGAESDSLNESGSGSTDRHHHDPCCTLTCGVPLLTPTAFITLAYDTVMATVVHSTRDFGARPSTAPPGLGQGPRAPPVFS